MKNPLGKFSFFYYRLRLVERLDEMDVMVVTAERVTRYTYVY
jgi:hypothetical protein